MNFVVAMVLLNIFAHIKARQKYVSSDIASEYSHQKMSVEDVSSEDETNSYEDGPPMTSSIEYFHHGVENKIARKQLETRRWHTSCVRKASKLCTKACQKAFKSACRKRKCSSRAKRALKRECKKSCPNHFIIDRDRAAYEE